MKRLIGNIIINMVSIQLSAYFVTGIQINSLFDLFLTSLVFGFVNYFLKPVLKLLSFPITMLSMGLFLLVLNGFTLLLTAYFTPLYVSGLFAGIYGSIIISASNFIISIFFNRKRRNK